MDMVASTETASRSRGGKNRRKQAQQIPSHEWDTHKSEIKKLYLVDGLTQQAVVDHLKKERGFRAK